MTSHIQTREARDALLTGWTPESSGAVEDEGSDTPAKRARIVATSQLYQQLCTAVFTALRDREERDRAERVASRDIAARFPLSSTDSEAATRADSPQGVQSAAILLSAKVTPMIRSSPRSIESALPALTLDVAEEADSVHGLGKRSIAERPRTSPLPVLKKTGSSECLDSMDRGALSMR